MAPTLRSKQLTLLWKPGHTVEYDAIVVLDPRTFRKRTLLDPLLDNFLLASFTGGYWIKRVIGKPGDELELRTGLIYRNGQLVKEPYLPEPMRDMPDVRFTVPDNHVFVLGDNRNHSMDSRAIGPVPLSHILGKVVFK